MRIIAAAGVFISLGLMAIVVLAAIALAVAQDKAARVPDKNCVIDDNEREHIRKIMSDAFERSFRNYVDHLFDVWLKDTNEVPVRAVSGINISVNAYTRARNFVAHWNPPLCLERK